MWTQSGLPAVRIPNKYHFRNLEYVTNGHTNFHDNRTTFQFFLDLDCRWPMVSYKKKIPSDPDVIGHRANGSPSFLGLRNVDFQIQCI